MLQIVKIFLTKIEKYFDGNNCINLIGNENIENSESNFITAFPYPEEKQEKYSNEKNLNETVLDNVKVFNNIQMQDAKNLISEFKISQIEKLNDNQNRLHSPEKLREFKLLNTNKSSIQLDSHYKIKDTIVRQNSNFLSETKSIIIQERENLFSLSKINNRYADCNHDINNDNKICETNLYNFEISEKNSLVNSEVFDKKLHCEGCEHVEERKDNSRSHIAEHEIEIENEINNSNIVKEGKEILRCENHFKKVNPKEKVLNKFGNRNSVQNENFSIKDSQNKENFKKIIPKRISLINSAKKSTIKSETSNNSSYQTDKLENVVHAQKVREFEKIIKNTKLVQTTSNHVRTYTTEMNLKTSNKNNRFNKIPIDDKILNNNQNTISINKYKFLFSDVDENLNQRNHNYSQGQKNFTSLKREKKENKNFNSNIQNSKNEKDFSDTSPKLNSKKSFIIGNKISNFSNILI